MPRPRVADSVKKAQGTFRPSRAHRPAPAPPALGAWPSAPSHFGPEEVAAFARLGEALGALGTVAASDLPLVELTARLMARLDAMLADPKAKPTAVNALANLVSNNLKALGAAPSARRGVDPLTPAGAAPAADDPLDEFTR